MSQSGYTPISLYYSSTASAVPTAGNLVAGELALNNLDGKLFYKDSAGVVQTIASKNGVAGGSNTQVQYNSSGSLAGSANLTFNGTTLTTANDASISGLTVGKGGGSATAMTVLGYQAANATNTVGYNTVIGYQSFYSNTSGSDNVSIGYQSLYNNTTASENVAIGDISLKANTTGANNIAIGQAALNSNTTASNNTAVGYQAGYSNTTGGLNVYLGYQAGYNISSGSNHVYVGTKAGYLCTATVGNTFVGDNAGSNVTTGKGNTFIGTNNDVAGPCGNAVTTGSYNTIIGSYTGNQGGLDIRTANNYIVLSDGDGNPRGIFDSSGNFLVGKTSTATTALGWNLSPIAGNAKFDTGQYFVFNRDTNDILINFRRSDTSVGNINVTTTATAYVTSSDYRLKEEVKPMSNALDKIAQLKPCTYKWKIDGSDGEGFIAHELAEVVPQAVSGEKDAINEDGTIKAQGIDTSFLVATLVAAIQELKAEIDQLKGVK